MPVNVKLENFDGPFDLLLHLIKKNEMDIYDIKIYDITTQYLEYLDALKGMDLEVTSEFIVTAATLIEIKSKMLLPKPKDEVSADDDLDPRKELVQKLIEYRKFKEAAVFFKKNEIGMMFSKNAETIKEIDYNPNDFLKDLSISKLYDIYMELLERNQDKINHFSLIEKKITLDQYKIEDKMTIIIDEIKDNKRLLFKSIMKKCSCKIEIVVTFLAVLELIKQKRIKVLQNNNFGEIFIEGAALYEED